MNEIIRKRKSIRKYDLTPLDAATLEKVRAKIAGVKPLYSNIRYSIEITDKTKGIMGVKAPHYLIFGSEEKDGSLENIGFIGQQMDLFFSASELGSCWLGVAKPDEREASALPYVDRNVYFLWGRGKTTIANELHRKYGYYVYDV